MAQNDIIFYSRSRNAIFYESQFPYSVVSMPKSHNFEISTTFHSTLFFDYHVFQNQSTTDQNPSPNIENFIHVNSQVVIPNIVNKMV